MPDQLRLLHLIDGQWREGGGQRFLDLNPALPGQIVAEGLEATEGEVDDAVCAARKSARDWAATPIHERAQVLWRAAELLESRAEEFGTELTREEGKTLGEGVGEVRRAAQVLRYYAGSADRGAGEVYSSARRGERLLVVRRPVGVVAAITPFNFPIAIPAWKIAAALVYGNTVVWKPAMSVPLLAMRLAQVFTEAGLPNGVLNLVYGQNATGAALVGHALVNAVTFTGSTQVGRHIAADCARRGVSVQAEMGGKNAAIVLRDADVELALDQVVAGAFRSAGQKCTATSRLVLDAPIADEFLQLLQRRVAALQIGDPLDPSVNVGPVIDGYARDRIASEVAAAIAAGATVVAAADQRRANSDDTGFYISPTVLEVEHPKAPIWEREIFGPILAVQRADGFAQAVQMANEGDFGLSASIFTQDVTAALAAIDSIDVGVLHVNSETAGADPHVPFGGLKASGMGPKEQGEAARDFFTQSTTVYLTGGRSPHRLPFDLAAL
ncbi:Aldehyde dehydrogenase, thermostable [Mycolicibacterium vanbaalenii]|uniref:Aldehyde dehydrogenase, thermostable n=1 Tax=Mycolicibacterium vanbaalenii TaxID=110539 RepID=A0A5S9RB70_MYCVN|nr:aldehyde dehydrogenase family protein [Mycolicibacterium vanbaalenii]CAA0137534.1 Aldehyde dehydrogenase, thermostable [Mycolicibacterium vanbaalenii]